MQAEGYNIEVKPKWPNLKYPGIDFGTVRVQEPKTIPLTIPNTGKYPVEFKFNLKTPLIRRLFTFEPDAGDIQPGDTATIEVRVLDHVELISSPLACGRSCNLLALPIYQFYRTDCCISYGKGES